MSDLSIEEIIQEAQKQGVFDNLPGKGKPLHLDPSPDAVVKGLLKEANVKPEWIEVAGEIDRLHGEGERLLESYSARYTAQRARLEEMHGRNAAPAGDKAGASRWRHWWRGFVAGSGLGQWGQNRRREDELAAFVRDWDGVLTRYAGLLHTINRKIRRFNYLVPAAWQQRVLIPVEERLLEFVHRFPHLVRGEDGTLQTISGAVPAALLCPSDEKGERAMPRDLRQARVLYNVRRRGRKYPPPLL